MEQSAEDIIEALGMEPHPEGGWFCRVFTHPVEVDGRAIASAIYFLLQAGDRSQWHRFDAVELWHFYAGAPLRLSWSVDAETVDSAILGNDLGSGARPQLVVPSGVWQSAESLGAYTLVGCTVSPAFDFGTFELAPPGWSPGR